MGISGLLGGGGTVELEHVCVSVAIFVPKTSGGHPSGN